jgi:hypothetical protein
MKSPTRDRGPRGGRSLACVVLGVALSASPALADDVRDRILVNGFTEFEFEKQLEKKGFGDPNGSFDVDTIGFVLNVHASDRIRISLESDWSHGADARQDGGVVLEYGFLEYTISDLAKVRVGKFLTPMGIFNEVHNVSYSFASVKLPSATNKTGRIIKDAFLFYPRYAAGIALHGDGTLGSKDFSYDVLLANGDTVTTSAEPAMNPYQFDTNFSKSLTMRFRFEPSPYLRVGASFYHDTLTDVNANSITSGGFEAEYSRKNAKLIGEVMFGTLRHLDATTDAQVGWYLHGQYKLGHFTPYARIEGVSLTDRPGNHGNQLVTGLDFEVSKNLFVKAENNRFWGGPNSSLATLPGSKYNEIKAAVAFGF